MTKSYQIEQRLTLVAINESRARSALEKLVAIERDLTAGNRSAPFYLSYAIAHTRETLEYLTNQRESIQSSMAHEVDSK